MTSMRTKNTRCWMRFMLALRPLGYLAHLRARQESWRRRTRISASSCLSWMPQGTPDRGKAFQDVVYGDFGRNEIPDHVAVLKQLAAARRYMDMTRVGVFGGSFGGYFAIRAMLQAPDTFHVGVAVEPLTDLRQVSGSGLILLGPPDSNKEAYDFASNLRLAGNLKGHLLLIHGTSDVNAPLTATIQMINALITAGKPYDLVLLPDQDHAPSGPYAAYYVQAQKRYLVEHLRP